MKTLRITLAAILTGESAAEFLASKPVMILLILAAAVGWYYAIRSSSADGNSSNSNPDGI